MIRDFKDNHKYAAILAIIMAVFIIICLIASCEPVTDSNGKTWEPILNADTCGCSIHSAAVWKYDYYYNGVHYLMFDTETSGEFTVIDYTQDSLALAKAKREDEYWQKTKNENQY